MVAAVSWSVATAIHRAADIRGAVEHVEPTAELSDAQTEQLRLAKLAAIRMLDDGIVGDAASSTSEAAFRVQVYGHVSEPGQGAPPSVTVIVEQMPASNAVDPPANDEG
jgi:hypothetical protein